MKKYIRFIPLYLFALFIVGFSLTDLLIPDREFSEMENTVLSTYTPPTKASLANNTFMTNFETYINDQFIFRSEWITLKSVGESLLGKTENNGIVYGKNNMMFDKTVSLDEKRMNSNLDFLKEFAEEHPNQQITLTLVPSSYNILSEDLPKGLNLPQQIEEIDSVYSSLTDTSIKTIDVTSTLMEHKKEYIYYRTDHHWTTTGAYLAYEATMDQLGMDVPPQPNYPAQQVDDFYGTYYSKALYYATLPDTLTYYDIPLGSITIDGALANGLYDTEQFEERDKYAGFLRGNNGLTVLERPEPTGANRKILLLKDSYGNSFAPFLLEQYDQVYVVDLRHRATINDLLQKEDFDTISFLYSFANFTTDGNLIKILSE